MLFRSITVVNNLTSSSTTSALSANQGRILKSCIDALKSQSGSSNNYTFAIPISRSSLFHSRVIEYRCTADGCIIDYLDTFMMPKMSTQTNYYSPCNNGEPGFTIELFDLKGQMCGSCFIFCGFINFYIAPFSEISDGKIISKYYCYYYPSFTARYDLNGVFRAICGEFGFNWKSTRLNSSHLPTSRMPYSSLHTKDISSCQ